jgi:type IV fimbrial biogenesis protein FimT
MLVKFSKGFTLIEILITLAIIAILVAVASPSFINIIKRDRLVTNTNHLHNTFKYARSEAIKREQVVSISTAGSKWSVTTVVDGELVELKVFNIEHESIAINLDDVEISSIGVLTAKREYLVEDGDNATADYTLCILQSGQSWIVEKPALC